MPRTIAILALLAAAPLPPAPRWVPGKVVDVIGEVADPYRGLENAADPAVRAWSDAENARTRAFLDASEAERHFNQAVYRHRIGEPATKDVLLLSGTHGLPRTGEIFLSSAGGAVASVQLGDGGQWQQFVLRDGQRAERLSCDGADIGNVVADDRLARSVCKAEEPVAGGRQVIAPSTLPAAAGPLLGYQLVHDAPVATTLATPDLPKAATVWCAMLGKARRTADFEQFYVSGKPGSRLDRVIGCMEAAAKRGVAIRFLMEAKGLAMSDAPTLARLRAIPGLQFRTLSFAGIGGSGIIHAKFFVVDGNSAYVGSQNFDWRSLEHIDETGVKIDDAHAVGQLSAIFAQDWAAQATLANGGRVAPTNTREVAANDSGPATLVASPNAFNPPGVGDSQAELVKLLGEAKHDVRVTVMDYAPLDQQHLYYGVIDSALRAAAARGVAVRLLVADWDLTRAKTPWLVSLAAIPNVEIRVATIPTAPEGPIPFARVVHTKSMTIDGRIGWVGTSNWEGGYLDTSRNVELVFRDAGMAQQIGDMQTRLWDSAYAKPLDVAIAAKRAGEERAPSG